MIKKDWIYITWKKYLYIDIRNPKKTMNKLKGVFKPLKLYFRFTIDEWAPYPVLWVSKPAYIQIMFNDVGWKDKYDTPRFEYHPYIWIHIWKFNLIWWWEYSNKLGETEDYWEQALWYLYYSDNNIKKAKETWPWEDYETKKSSWNDKFLMK